MDTIFKHYQVNPLTGLTQNQVKQQQHAHSVQDLAVFDSLQMVQQQHKYQKQFQDQSKSFQILRYWPILCGILFSYIGFCFEAIPKLNSINFCNLVCWLMFLPIYVACDFKSIYKIQPKQNLKDIIINDKLNEDQTQNDQIQESQQTQIQLPNDNVQIEDDFIIRKAKQYINSSIQDLLQQFEDTKTYTIIRNGNIEKATINEIVEGDILFLQEGQNVPADCYQIPIYATQKTLKMNSIDKQSEATNFCKIVQPIIKTEIQENIIKQLFINNVKTLNTDNFYQIFPKKRYSTFKNIEQQDYKLENIEDINENTLYQQQSVIFAGYNIAKIYNKVTLKYDKFQASRMHQQFLIENQLSPLHLPQPTFYQLLYQMIKERKDSICKSNNGAAYIALNAAQGAYFIVINAGQHTLINKYCQKCNNIIKTKSKKQLEQDKLQADYQESSTIKATFFKHLMSLDKIIKKIPYISLIAIILPFLPHIIRFCFFKNYVSFYNSLFQNTAVVLERGLIPALCSVLSFCMCSFTFITYSFNLFKPMLKSAQKYVQTLQERKIIIRNLGSLESLGFSNTMVVDSSIFIEKRIPIQSVNIGARMLRGGVRQYSIQQIKQFESVFSNRIFKPFYILYNESEQSTWLSFVRFITSISLQCDEVYNILRNQKTLDNIYQDTYQANKQQQDRMPLVGSSLTFGLMKQLNNQQDQRIYTFTNESQNKNLSSEQQIFMFTPSQESPVFDFNHVIQCSCLQDSHVKIKQINPLLTGQRLIFICQIPQINVRICVARSENLDEILQNCETIISHSKHEIPIGNVSDISSEYEKQEQYKYIFDEIVQGSKVEIYKRPMQQKDIQYLKDTQKTMQKTMSNIMHYTVMTISTQQSDEEIINSKQFTYSFSVNFQAKINSKSASIIDRFSNYDQMSMNLVICDKNNQAKIEWLMKQLSLTKLHKQKKQLQDLYKFDDITQTTTQKSNYSSTNIEEQDRKVQLIVQNQQKTPIFNNKIQKQKQHTQQCVVLRGVQQNLDQLSNYILTKQFTDKRHLMLERMKQKIDKQKQQQKTKEEAINNISSENYDGGTTENDYLLIDEPSYDISLLSSLEDDAILHKKQKKHKKQHQKKQSRNKMAEVLSQSQINQQLLIKNIKKSNIQVIILSKSEAIDVANKLYNNGLYVTLINNMNDFNAEYPQMNTYQIQQFNKNVTQSEKPDMLIVNYNTQNVMKNIQDTIFEQLQQNQSKRISVVDTFGTHGLSRLLDAMQEIPYYLMTLSPVFLGTIRSRLVIALMPIIVCIAIIIFELVNCIQNQNNENYMDSLTVRPFFIAPIGSGIILALALLYVEFLLPYIIWTPPRKQLTKNEQTENAKFIGNRAAMLYDFNKLLPNKTSNKALCIFIIIVIVVGIIILLFSFNYYKQANQYIINNYLDSQLVSLSPTLSVFLACFLTAFASGTIAIANKLPLGQVWGYKTSLYFRIRKIVLFVLLQLLCLCFTFLVPQSKILSRFLMGYDSSYSTDEMNRGLTISFIIGIVIIIVEVLEQTLFIRSK